MFFLNNIYSQWEYVFNKSEKKIEAVGKVFYNETYKDSMILKLSKSSDLELSFSIEGDLFKEKEIYYVVLDISERKFKASKSKVEAGKYEIYEIKDTPPKKKKTIRRKR